MAEKLRTAIVGCGKVADLHAAAFVNLKESHFTAVCDTDKQRSDNLAAKYGVKGYTDVAEMVTKEKIDVVNVCTPHPVHRDPTIAAMEGGAHVLIEKPFASSLEDCDAMALADSSMVWDSVPELMSEYALAMSTQPC